MLQAGARSVTVQRVIHLQDSVSQAEAGSAGRAVEQQLVVQGGARRVRVSASEGIHEGAHRRGLGDLSRQQRWEAARGPAVDRLHVHLEIKLGAVPRPESLEGLHPQPSDRGVRGLRQLQGRGGPDHAVNWEGWQGARRRVRPRPQVSPVPTLPPLHAHLSGRRD